MVHLNQISFTPVVKCWFNIQKSISIIHHINKVKKKWSVQWVQKNFEKVQHQFMIKSLRKLRKGKFVNLIKSIFNKPTFCFLPKERKKAWISTTSIQYFIWSFNQCHKAIKRSESQWIGKIEAKLFHEQMVWLCI